MPGLSAAEIRDCIPHRPPFLWIDEVLEIGESRILARTRLDPKLEIFRGHYPDFPVFPGVLQCEMCFQAAAILISRMQAIESGKAPVVTRINNVKFRQMVRPGDVLEIDVVLNERLSNAFYCTGKIVCAGKTAAQLDFTCASADVNIALPLQKGEFGGGPSHDSERRTPPPPTHNS